VELYFVETPSFSRRRDDYFSSDEEFRHFQLYLLENPEAGDVIRGTHGARKIRWGDSQHATGKRGGFRVIYGYLPRYKNIHLITIYRKVSKEDLTTDECRAIAALMQQWEKQLAERRPD
jgi:hypothetical protein